MSLIDVNALKEDLKQKILDNRIYNQDVKTFVKVLIEISIDHMPTIEPVKRGKWIKIGKHHIQDWQMMNKCSACGHAVSNSSSVDSVIYFKFCPHCGAAMENE